MNLAGRAAQAARVGASIGAQLAGAGASVARSTARLVLGRLERAGGLGREPHPYERSARGRGTGEPSERGPEPGVPSDEALAALAEEEEAAALAEEEEAAGLADEAAAAAISEGEAAALADDEAAPALADEEAAALADEEVAALADEDEAAALVEAAERPPAPDAPGEVAVPDDAIGVDVEPGEGQAGGELPIGAAPEPEPEPAAGEAPASAPGGPLGAEPPPAPPADLDAAARAATEPGAAPPAEGHVDTGAEVVAELAESGAEEGAGAEVEVAEPWPGYAGMTAADVRRRLGGADAASATAVVLYERANRGRKSVLEAAERRLARARPGR